MKIYILRHEQRPNNPGFNTTLTEQGKHRAMFSLKATLSQIKFTHVFSSPFKRTLETIAPYLNENDCSVNIEYGLAEGLHDPVFMQEKDFTVKEVMCNVSNYESVVNVVDYKYFENDETISNRVEKFYNELWNNHKNEDHTILLVTHKCICNKLLSLITKKERDKEDDFKMGKLATCDENNEIIWIN